VSRRLFLLGPPLLTAHFPPTLLLPLPLPPSRPSDLSLPPPALHQTRPWGIRQSTDITSCAIVGSCSPTCSLPSDLDLPFVPSLPSHLCSPPTHDLGTNLESRPLRRPPPPSTNPATPETALCNKKSALRPAAAALPSSRLSSHSRSTSLLHSPKGRSRESKINKQSCAIAVRDELLYRLVSPRNPTKQLDCCSRPLASRHHCPSLPWRPPSVNPLRPSTGHVCRP
jgi:hypothetical protein